MLWSLLSAVVFPGAVHLAAPGASLTSPCADGGAMGCLPGVWRPIDGGAEWWVDRKGGVEHGFTLTSWAGDTVRLAVVLGDGVVDVTGDRAHYLADGLLHRYDQLRAWDALGRELPFHLEASTPTQVDLVVDARGAVGPLVIDPLVAIPGEGFANHDDFLGSDDADADRKNKPQPTPGISPALEGSSAQLIDET